MVQLYLQNFLRTSKPRDDKGLPHSTEQSKSFALVLGWNLCFLTDFLQLCQTLVNQELGLAAHIWGLEKGTFELWINNHNDLLMNDSFKFSNMCSIDSVILEYINTYMHLHTYTNTLLSLLPYCLMSFYLYLNIRFLFILLYIRFEFLRNIFQRSLY